MVIGKPESKSLIFVLDVVNVFIYRELLYFFDLLILNDVVGM